jgi:tRNA wybutosine-synthesizing protein 1
MVKQASSLAVIAAAIATAATVILLKKYLASETEKNIKAAERNDGNPNQPALDSSVTQAAPVTEVNFNESPEITRRILTRGSITIVHASMTGTCLKLAQQLFDKFSRSSTIRRAVQLCHTQDFDWWDELSNDEDEVAAASKLEQPALLIFFLPTYTNGSWSPSAVSLETALSELLTDWRIAKFPLKNKLNIAVFGTGSSEYDSIGVPAKQCVRWLTKLGAKCIVRPKIGDDAVGNHVQDTFNDWQGELFKHILPIVEDLKAGCNCKTAFAINGSDSKAGCCQSGSIPESKTCCADNTAEDDEEFDSDEEEDHEPEVIDVEDMGDAVLASSHEKTGASEPREMVTPSQAAALKKEGYKLIGTHSAVKLCRWTKHQLRGRGGCYKHTFYGITSYQCMEATPSLACANKCVFCWRHHKNPVGKEWRWKTDDPHFIVERAVQTHVQMIKEARGIPGVQMDRWKEAHTVKHCALSLVGEPIMYPRIDELLGDLHSRKISTFLVTNGQHPEAIDSIRPITQLYVSVDAPTEERLIEIDRPLFKDAWDRLKLSLTSLKAKGQRTVARLTVVKGWNSDELEGYAKLIALGHVSLVEVKGVTFCGKSDASNLNMSNTPWHHEVVDLTRTLKHELDKLRQLDRQIPEYGLACEHKHSCSVLLARVDQFAVDNQMTGKRTWRTWIDYEKFHELAKRNVEDASFKFSVEEYTSETPDWALFGAEEEGFDPTDKRHRRNTKHPKYTDFDENGIPTHDEDGHEVSENERLRLIKLMHEKTNEVGAGSTVTELKGGAKKVEDPSLMFRGMVVTK